MIRKNISGFFSILTDITKDHTTFCHKPLETITVYHIKAALVRLLRESEGRILPIITAEPYYHLNKLMFVVHQVHGEKREQDQHSFTIGHINKSHEQYIMGTGLGVLF
ncbi:hypothetical protein KIL84_007495 [Mauremys mutica]|uniref:Uncharacterized protein n=1 Tax=Mauremys mutica TaxID=74926 RepID=A0A9D3X1F0_9SAUR|nr:hypothetical protein KIL84_007495 [Mauremys mutica]